MSVKHHGLKDKNGRVISVRLKGGMFAKSFNGVKFERHIKEIDSRKYQSERGKHYRSRMDKMQLAEGIEIK